jgi:uncharacterized protein YegP (UPF0339 family)
MSNKVASVEVFKGGDGQWRWRSKAHNGRIISSSGEGYEHKKYAHDIAAAIFKDAPIFYLGEDE